MRPVEKTISVSDVQRDLEAIVQSVATNNDSALLEIGGEQKAAVVPVEVYGQWQSRRQNALDNVHKIAEQANVPEDEAHELNRGSYQSRSR